MPDSGFQKTNGGHRNLEVYRIAHDLAVRVHKMTLQLPPFETHEEGSQVRRSAKRVSASIVEGFALRMYKAQFLSYLYRALASSDETQEHLELLCDTGSLKDAKESAQLLKASQELSRKLLRLIQSVGRQHGTPYFLAAGPDEMIEAEPGAPPAARNPKSGIRNREVGS
jgi:four helix bundle protein